MIRRRSPLPVLAALLIGLAVLSAGPAPAPAQDRDRLEQYIARTGEIIDRARDVVRESDSQRARRVLQEAERLHQRSQQMSSQGRDVMAYGMSRRARQGAQQAARFGREAGGHEERARLRLERYREVRDQLADRAREAGDERALRFLRDADEQAQRASDHFRQGNHAMAIELVEAAETMLGRTARLLFEGGGAARLEREHDRVRELIERTAEQLAAADPAARATGTDLLRSAREVLARAREADDRGRPLQALQSLRLARQLVGQAAAAVGGGLTAEAVSEQLARWDDRAEMVADRVRESGSRDRAAILTRAREHRRRAGALADGGEFELALRQLRAAFDLLDEANESTR